MPNKYSRHLPYTLLVVPLIVLIVSMVPIRANEGIQTYYIRYDVKSSGNKIIEDNLLMVPAKNEFRAEKFSQFYTTGVISAAPAGPGESIEQRIRNNALKAILVNNGLKSVKTKDTDTVISYEGVITTPLNILKNTYHQGQDNYVYEVQVEFSPMAFPDEWETLGVKDKIKGLFHDFFQLFK